MHVINNKKKAVREV